MEHLKTRRNTYKWVAVVFIALGITGWLGPLLLDGLKANSNYEVKNIKINNIKNYVTDATIYKPSGEGPFPAVLFGAGSGADRVIYAEYAEAFVKEGFVVLIYGATYGKQQLFENNTEGWALVTDCAVSVLEYLKEIDYVDAGKIIVAGHSGGANTAYRIALRIPEEILGVIAIAGRWVPETENSIKTNLLLAVGAKDSIVPPSKIKDAAYKLTGREAETGVLYGSFNNKDALKISVSSWSGHLTEAWDEKLIKESARWAASCIGKEYNGNYVIEKITFSKIILKLIAGILFLFGIVILTCRYFLFNRNKYLNYLEPFLYFSLFYIILSTTLSKYFIYLQPVSYKISQYIVGAVISLTAAALFNTILRKLNNKYWVIYNALYILITIIIFIFITDWLLIQSAPSIWLSTIIFKSAVLFLFLYSVSVCLFLSRLSKMKVIMFNMLCLMWLLPVTIPLF